MTEVRTTVDEKIAMANAEPAKENLEEVKDAPDVEETPAPDNDPYMVPEAASEDKEAVLADKDEFGNTVAKAKLYTEEEVNDLIRQRMNRTRKEEVSRQPTPEQNTTSSVEGEEDWEKQLEGVIKNTFKKISVEEQERANAYKEQQALGKLQVNIHTSMSKYKDFEEVVGRAPMSDFMVKSTKNFKDPGAFIYAASKTQFKELERISQLSDPLDQAAEMGRLEERMRKARSGTNSPKPVSDVKGDIANRENIRANVDDLIKKHALKKFRGRI
jgi:hypothetical protein